MSGGHFSVATAVEIILREEERKDQTALRHGGNTVVRSLGQYVDSGSMPLDQTNK